MFPDHFTMEFNRMSQDRSVDCYLVFPATSDDHVESTSSQHIGPSEAANVDSTNDAEEVLPHQPPTSTLPASAPRSASYHTSFHPYTRPRKYPTRTTSLHDDAEHKVAAGHHPPLFPPSHQSSGSSSTVSPRLVSPQGAWYTYTLPDHQYDDWSSAKDHAQMLWREETPILDLDLTALSDVSLPEQDNPEEVVSRSTRGKRTLVHRPITRRRGRMQQQRGSSISDKEDQLEEPIVPHVGVSGVGLGLSITSAKTSRRTAHIAAAIDPAEMARLSRIKSEQDRRSVLTKGFAELHDVLPRNAARVTKQSIINRATAYIPSLQRQVQDLQGEIEEMKRGLRVREDTIDRLSCAVDTPIDKNSPQ